MRTRLKAEGVSHEGGLLEEAYGQFAWVIDPDGRKVELWQSIEKVPEYVNRGSYCAQKNGPRHARPEGRELK